MKKQVLAFTLALGVLTLSACGSEEDDSKANVEYFPVVAERSNIDSTISISGTVKSNNEIEVDAPFDMTYDSLQIEVGNYVEEGQVIAYLSPDDIADMKESMQSAYETAIEDLNTAAESSKQTETVTLKSPYEGYVKNIKVKEGDEIADVMNEYGYLAQIVNSKQEIIYNIVGVSGTVDFVNDLEGKKVDVGSTILQATKESGDFQDKVDKVNDLTAKMKRLNEYETEGIEITSPETGVISSLTLDETNNEIKMDSPLMKLVDPDEFYVSSSVSETNYSKIGDGTRVICKIDALNKYYDGEVTYVSNVGTNGSFPIKVSLTGANDLKLGMTATLKVVTNSYEDCLVVPIDAVFTNTDGTRYVLLESDTPTDPLTVDARAQVVTVGKTDGSNIEIVQGLEVGQKILEPIMATYVPEGDDSSDSSGDDGSISPGPIVRY